MARDWTDADQLEAVRSYLRGTWTDPCPECGVKRLEAHVEGCTFENILRVELRRQDDEARGPGLHPRFRTPAGRSPMPAASSPAGRETPAGGFSSSSSPTGSGGPSGPPAPGRLLEEVLAIVQERQATYGPPSLHWATTVAVLNVLFADYLAKPLPTSAWPKFLIIDKLVRSQTGTYIRDHAADVAGYASGWAEVEDEPES